MTANHTPTPIAEFSAWLEKDGELWLNDAPKSAREIEGVLFEKKTFDRFANSYAANQTTITDLRKAVEELVEALKAERQMRKANPPKKLDEELCWRENDEKAERMAVNALAKSEKLLRERP